MSTSGTGTYDCEMTNNHDRNEDVGAAILIDDSFATFDDCDFTDDTSIVDNHSYDIYNAAWGFRYEYGAGTTVTCDDEDCGSSSLAWHGASSVTEYVTSSDKEFGNIYLADTTWTLDEMNFWIMTQYDCTPTFRVYESTTYNGTLTQVWSGTSSDKTNGGTEEYYLSPPIGIPVTSGRYYTLVLDVDATYCGTLDYTYGSSISSSEAHFGTHIGRYNNGSASDSGNMYYTTVTSSH